MKRKDADELLEFGVLFVLDGFSQLEEELGAVDPLFDFDLQQHALELAGHLLVAQDGHDLFAQFGGRERRRQIQSRSRLAAQLDGRRGGVQDEDGGKVSVSRQLHRALHSQQVALPGLAIDRRLEDGSAAVRGHQAGAGVGDLSRQLGWRSSHHDLVADQAVVDHASHAILS